MRDYRQSSPLTVALGPFPTKADPAVPRDDLTPDALGGGLLVSAASSAPFVPDAVKPLGGGYAAVTLPASLNVGPGCYTVAFDDPASFGLFFDDIAVLSPAVYDAKYGTVAPSTYAGGPVASVAGDVGGRVVGSVGSVNTAVAANLRYWNGAAVTTAVPVNPPAPAAPLSADQVQAAVGKAIGSLMVEAKYNLKDATKVILAAASKYLTGDSRVPDPVTGPATGTSATMTLSDI